MDLYDIAVARKLSGGGGGGGSSDFSTAQVTIINESESFSVNFYSNYEDSQLDMTIVTGLLEIDSHYVDEWEFTNEEETVTCNFLIIDGFAILIGDITMSENAVTVTGDIDKFINGDGLVEIHIRGNGNITIS